jgi:hypothetical protein
MINLHWICEILRSPSSVGEDLSPWILCPVDWRVGLLMNYAEDVDIRLFRKFFTCVPV